VPLKTIYLAFKKTLLKKYCSDVAFDHFNHIYNLKNNSSFADFLPKSIPDMATFKKWLFIVKTVFKRSD
jgi:hypothetical protein